MTRNSHARTTSTRPSRGQRNRQRKSKPTAHKARSGARVEIINAKSGRGRSRTRGRGSGGRGGLNPISISKTSIHSQWKQQLGGLIRYYIHERTKSKDEKISQEELEIDVEKMYYSAGCSIEATKHALLAALGITKDFQNDWVDLNMAIDSQGLEGDVSLEMYPRSVDGKGIILPHVERPGEGFHSHQRWTNVVIPEFAMGKSFYFQVKNHTPFNLSCEISLDDHTVARNAPLPPKQTRTVKPNNNRYFEAHKWTLQPAKKVNFNQMNNVEVEDKGVEQEDQTNQRRNNPRYNGIRPNYNRERVNNCQYPDPTNFGWTFTGSVEQSKVEFFEKRLNIGLAKMDWFYSTGTVKTILDHPTTGRNALFRGEVSPEQFVNICKNPRTHTSRGYRRYVDRPSDSGVPLQGQPIDVDMDARMKEDEFDQDIETPATGNSDDATTYYARNDKYDFKTQGHFNRRNEMNKLHNNYQFSNWEKASKKEWAVIHAKFYISLPKRTARVPGKLSRSTQNRKRQLEHLPDQASVIDIKSAENATLGTKFVSVGSSNQRTRRSTVRMNRINGLNDDVKWKGGPLFEKKLFYRAENILSNNLDSDEDQIDDKEMSTESLYAKQTSSFDEYKVEKIQQVRQYHVEHEEFNPDNAEILLLDFVNRVASCQSIADIDELVKIYYNEVIKSEINRHGGRC